MMDSDLPIKGFQNYQMYCWNNFTNCCYGIHYNGHKSYNNPNGMYWKETNNFNNDYLSWLALCSLILPTVTKSSLIRESSLWMIPSSNRDWRWKPTAIIMSAQPVCCTCCNEYSKISNGELSHKNYDKYQRYRNHPTVAHCNKILQKLLTKKRKTTS